MDHPEGVIRQIKNKGRRRFPGREDPTFLGWLRALPCAVCEASGQFQSHHTEVEHWVTKARGGYDKGDTFPTCQRHRIERHDGDETFQRHYPQRDWSKAGKQYADEYDNDWPDL